MEKHEAEKFVIECFKHGDKEGEIVNKLALLLGAPIGLIKRFVNQVIETHLQTPDSDTGLPSSPDLRDSGKKNVTKQSERDDSPLIEEEIPIKENDFLKATSPKQKEVHRPNIQNEIKKLNEPEEGSPHYEYKINELERFVLHKIKKHHRYNDILQSVCEQTGWDWNKAQLFVAKTQTKNHQELTRSNRIFMIPFSCLFIICGFLLLLWSITTFFEYKNGVIDQISRILSVDYLSLIVGGFFTSFGIIAGGIYGLYRTLSNQ